MNETAEACDEKAESFSPSSSEFQLDEMTTSERSEPELESTRFSVSQGKMSSCHIAFCSFRIRTSVTLTLTLTLTIPNLNSTPTLTLTLHRVTEVRKWTSPASESSFIIGLGTC